MNRFNSFPAILSNRLSNNQLQKNSDYIYEILENTKNLPQKFEKNKLAILISGLTSGSGKDSIVNSFPKNFQRIKTCTTRPQRPEEVKNDPYIRLTLKGFEESIKKGEFLETNFYNGNYYGSKISEIRKIASQGKIPVLRIDPIGSKNVLQILKENPSILDRLKVLYFFIIVPSKEVLKNRIFKRDVEIVSNKKKKEEAEAKALIRVESTFESDLSLLKYAHFVAVNYDGKLKEVTENIVKTFNSYL